MEDFLNTLTSSGFSGDIDQTPATKDFYSHDASLFEVRPQLVVKPKNTADVEKLVQNITHFKKTMPDLSLTGRGAGTDMSGGAINDSVIADFSKYFTAIKSVNGTAAQVQPGVFYRDFEVETFKHGSLMPSFPASRQLCTVGGMVNSNAGGEKSLEFGKTEQFINELEMVWSDGVVHTVKPLNQTELKAKMQLDNFEGQVYRQMFKLCDDNYDQIKQAKPKVTKDSTGYHLWNVWDRQTGIFDLTKVVAGAQGTLGMVTDINFKLIKNPKHSGTLVMFLRSLDDLGQLINDVMQAKPATFEGFDNYTLMLSIKLFYYFHQTLGWAGIAKLGLQLIPDLFKLGRGIPKMVLLIEFTGDTPEEVATKVHNLRLNLKNYKHESLFEEDETENKEKKFWIMRRESFNLLRKKVKDKHTAPFIDDLVVNPQYLPEFLPKLRAIIKKYDLLATIAGHMGDGNFHVIPLMRLEDQAERDKLKPAMKEVNELVLSYKGSLSGEHGDGLIRGPWLKQMYGEQILELFIQTKRIFDPDNIYNPHKKAFATWGYSFSHIRDHF